MRETRKTLCNRDCPDACGLSATVEDGRVVELRGDKEHPVTRGSLCYRTSQFLSTQYSPERLQGPLLRRGGELVPVEWDEALDFVAEHLVRIRAESGPKAIFHYRSGGSLGLLKTLCDLFFERFGPCTVKRGDICSGAGDAAQHLDFGVEDSHDLFDLYHARHIILWGKNAQVSSPHTFQVLLEARRRGARLVMVDPVHHRTGEACEKRWAIRPGGDFFLAMAVARVLFEQGWADPAWLARCDQVEGYRALVFSRPLEEWCARAELPVEAAADLARRLGTERPTAQLVGWGLGRRTGGATTIRALDALAAVSGNLGLRGGGVSYYFWRRRAFDTSFVDGKQAAPRTVCEISFGRDVMAAADPPIRAVWVTAGNPVTMLPDSRATEAALRSRELVVVVDSFLTDTARCATVVLPTTTLLEADDLVGSYGHHWVGAATPVVPPPAGVRSDLEIVQALAARVGLSEAVAGTARQWKERLSQRLAGHGVSLESLARQAVKSPFAQEVLFADGRVPTASGKVQLLTEAPPEEEPVSAAWPLKLMALSTQESQCSQWAHPSSALLEVTVHPDSAAGLADGAEALLSSALGSMRVRVRHDARQRRDVCLCPKGGHLALGRCANALVRPRLTDAGEGGALYEEPVRLTPA